MWTQSIRFLLSEAELKECEMIFSEVGHGNVLTNLITTIERDWKENHSSEESGDALSKVQAWNKKHPVGTAVKSSVIDQANLRTRTEAMVLFQHRAAVYIEDFQGYFDLDELTAEV